MAAPAALAYLAVAALRGGRARTARAAVLAVVVGLTVAQPFGVRATRIDPGGGGRSEAVDAWHRIGTFRFQAYRRAIVYLNGESGDPTDWLKVRSSLLVPGLLTNGAKLDRLCGTSGRPCWTGSGELQLRKDGDGWRYEVLDGRRPGAKPVAAYRLSTGIVSPAGLGFWVLAVALLMAPLATRPRPSAPRPARPRPTR